MLYEIFTTSSMAGVALSSYYFQNRESGSDHEKIIKIAEEAGLKSKEGGIRIYRKSRNKEKAYAEYVYKLPLGLSLRQFEDKMDLFVDGLNNKSRREFTFANFRELKTLDWKGNIPEQLQNIFVPRIYLDKHVEITYDGMLRFKVYETGLADMYVYDDELLSKVRNWQIPIGYDRGGLVRHDFEIMQMMVVAGMTRYGKTVMLKNIITTLIHNEPDNAEFTLIDLKGGLAFNRFANCKQVKTVAKNSTETLDALESIHDDMLAQQKLFLAKGYEDIGEAGYKKRHFVVIDEGAEIAGFEDKEERDRCTHLIGEIARIGAGLSYRMIFATQYPTADVFPRAIKSNTSASLCFRLKASTHSMVVLDKTGAEELPVGVFGRAIYQSDRDRIVQTPYIPNGFIDEKIKVHMKTKAYMDSNELIGGKTSTNVPPPPPSSKPLVLDKKLTIESIVSESSSMIETSKGDTVHEQPDTGRTERIDSIEFEAI